MSRNSVYARFVAAPPNSCSHVTVHSMCGRGRHVVWEGCDDVVLGRHTHGRPVCLYDT